VRRIIAVPKAEIDQQERDYRQEKLKQKNAR